MTVTEAEEERGEAHTLSGYPARLEHAEASPLKLLVGKYGVEL